MSGWLHWATPILASLTALLDAGHLAHLFSAEVLVLIAAIVTAIVGFIDAASNPAAPLPAPQQKK